MRPWTGQCALIGQHGMGAVLLPSSGLGRLGGRGDVVSGSLKRCVRVNELRTPGPPEWCAAVLLFLRLGGARARASTCICVCIRGCIDCGVGGVALPPTGSGWIAPNIIKSDDSIFSQPSGFTYWWDGSELPNRGLGERLLRCRVAESSDILWSSSGRGEGLGSSRLSEPPSSPQKAPKEKPPDSSGIESSGTKLAAVDPTGKFTSLEPKDGRVGSSV